VDEIDLKAISLHLNCDKLLNQTVFSWDQLRELKLATTKWKLEFLNSMKECSLSFNYPNFETEDWWTEQILFLGPPHLMSTILWEYENYKNKIYGEKSNQKNIERTVLTQSYIHQNYHSQTPPISLIRIDYTTIGKATTHLWNAQEKQWLMFTYQKFGLQDVLLFETSSFDGFNCNGSIIHCGDTFQMKHEETTFYGTLLSVLSCVSSVGVHFWIRIQSYTKKKDHYIGYQRYSQLKLGPSKYLPLGHFYWVINVVNLVPSYNKTNYFYHNSRIQVEWPYK